MIKVRYIHLILLCLLPLAAGAQDGVFKRTRSNLQAKWNQLPSADSILGTVKSRFAQRKTNTTAQIDSPIIAQPKEMHIGWANGRVWEYGSAYTIKRHEWRLNIMGPSSFGVSDKVELKSYPWLVFAPNLSLKYRFIDAGDFAVAIEPGVAVGGLPMAAAAGIFLPGAAVGGGTVGLLSFSDVFLKVYGSWHPTSKLTFSLRAGASHIRSSYYGLGGFAGVGKDGETAGFFPIGAGLLKTNWLMAGIEADYVLTPTNMLSLRSSAGKLYTTEIAGVKTNHTSDNYLMIPSLSYTHARKHLHLTVGIYGGFDPPALHMIQNNKLPVGPFANVYWVLNNRMRK